MRRRRIGDIFGDVWDAAGDAVDAVGGTVSDFANTDVGHFFFEAVASAGYQAVWPLVGPQLAAIAFIVPGVAAGEPADVAWSQEFARRVTNLAEILAPSVSREFADETQKVFGDQVRKATEALAPTWWAVGQPIADLADRLHIREDAAAAAQDLLSGAVSDATQGIGEWNGKFFRAFDGRQIGPDDDPAAVPAGVSGAVAQRSSAASRGGVASSALRVLSWLSPATARPPREMPGSVADGAQVLPAPEASAGSVAFKAGFAAVATLAVLGAAYLGAKTWL